MDSCSPEDSQMNAKIRDIKYVCDYFKFTPNSELWGWNRSCKSRFYDFLVFVPSNESLRALEVELVECIVQCLLLLPLKLRSRRAALKSIPYSRIKNDVDF